MRCVRQRSRGCCTGFSRTDSAAALLAACLIRFDNLGDIYNAMNDLKELAKKPASKKDDAALLANSFIASVGSDEKVASNVVATLATALTGWASTDVRANMSASEFDAELIVAQPTVVVLTRTPVRGQRCCA
jgi:type IV secretory pathway TraG/TraD family ATPase VirD4